MKAQTNGPTYQPAHKTQWITREGQEAYGQGVEKGKSSLKKEHRKKKIME